MHSDLLARVIQVTDGSIHIVFDQDLAILCTVENFFLLLSDINALKKKHLTEREFTADDINPDCLELEDIPGVDLLVILANGSISCYQTWLFKSFLQLFREGHMAAAITFVDTPAIETLASNSTHIDNAVPTVKETPKVASDLKIPDHYIRLSDYATQHGLTTQTVYSRIATGRMKEAVKINGHIYVDSRAVYIDGRAGRKSKTIDPAGRKYNRLRGNSYKEIQEYLEGRQLFTNAVRPYIYSYEEAKYYEKHSYREVFWNGRPILIIDIQPDYYSPLHKKTNRELILEGNSPVIPGNDTYRYHIHHVGRRPGAHSPFAIIPETDHNSPELYSVFHSAPAPKKELHGKAFEAEKAALWKKYLAEILHYGSYKKIPAFNHKRGRRGSLA